ncbi:MAG: RHS domain-containing protein [Neisseria sp.]|uniref:RHS domain-containing protein n=1 Tax=Neisseria sp. TaxID=192066 RepID=UPI0026DD519B|nr:RHS domain-containing protein [Neisseria sp.]MDO4640115.1 RHS domain-containing protein [Neisseria sp.]
MAHDQQGGTQETLFQYDAEGRLVRAADPHSITGFDYDANGRILQESFRFHRPEVDQSNALPLTDWRNPDHDLILQHTHRNVRYVYDANGNRTATHLPNGQRLDYLYYGSGHLHQISLNGNPLTDIERDKLHREIQRSQGKLNSRYQLDPLGRLKQQTAELQSLSETGSKAQTITAVKRSYGYDKTGNLTQSTDQRFGTTHYAYDQLGRITQAGEQRFAFDPAHNIVDKADQSVKDNLVTHYEGNQYVYDEYGNLIYRELPNGEIQKYQYDLKDQLIKAEIHQNGQQQTWRYTYDAIGRRIAKEQVENDPPRIFGEEACLKEAQPIAGSRTEFIWDGSHLLQETNGKGTYTYVYTDQDSYEPLAQIFDSKDPEQPQQTHYFHCDQIGIPREMTDKEGNLLWFGNYKGWELEEHISCSDY